jgi:type VI secretion system protein ImpH
VSRADELRRDPAGFDLFRVLREMERNRTGKPRIGENRVLDEELVSLSQDPFLDYPASNIAAVDDTPRGTPRLHTRFLGFFGPQGALPIATTAEALEWSSKDPSFVRFVNIFANRFLQLFFRAWSDARPITQHDRPDQDRFADYVGSFAGIGTPSVQDRDDVADIAKLSFAGLVVPRVKSARRLAQLLSGVFKLDVTIIERIGSWLTFEPSDTLALGAADTALGVSTFLGTRVYSIGDKFRVAIKAESLEQYRALLPNGALAGKLADAVFFYVGYRYDYEVELALPQRLAPPAQLGVSGQLGWTAWVEPSAATGDGGYLRDARFDLAAWRKATRSDPAGSNGRSGRTQ